MAAHSTWPFQGSPPRVGRDDVHLWRGYLDVVDSVVTHWASILSPDEQERADRFHSPLDRDRYITGRARLRIVLGRYLDQDPGELRFSYSPYGKPALVPAANTHPSTELHFNLSHCEGLVIYAVARGRNVGIDLERVREVEDSDYIARRFFSRRENTALRKLPARKWNEGFFQCWTRKEAYIKASGEGLSLPLDSFDVTVTGPAALMRTHSDDAARWSLVHLRPAAGYVGALAVNGSGIRLSCYELTDGELEPSDRVLQV